MKKKKVRLCPYNLYLQQVTQDTYECDEDTGKEIRCNIVVEIQRPTKCHGKACGAWRFGRCTKKS